MISASELASIRADAGAIVFDKTCLIEKNAKVIGAGGGSSANWVTVDANVPCALVSLATPTQQVLAQQDVGIDSRTLHAPYGTDLQTDYRVTINGVVYKVLSPYGDQTLQVFTSAIVLRKSPL